MDLCRKARDAAGSGIKRLQITAAVSPFVPKAHTPFQWEAQISLEEIRRRIGVLLEAVKKEKRIKLRWHEPDMSVLEGLFSRGDRRLADVVESAYRKGAIFASWMDEFSLAPWLEALAEHGLTLDEYTRERSTDAPLPWEHLLSGVSREFFLREREGALRGKTAGDCRYTTCRQCGACDTAAGPSGLERVPGMAEHARYGNILNKAQRDQEAHSVSLDQYGRVIVRDQGEKAPAPLEQATSGSETPGEEAGSETQERRPADRSPKPGTKSKPPALAPHLIQKAAQWRIRYARQDAAAYLSQLELQHIFDRALRRAGIPLSFSQGFHPLPLVSSAELCLWALPANASGFPSSCAKSARLRRPWSALTRPCPGACASLPWIPCPFRPNAPIHREKRTGWNASVLRPKPKNSPPPGDAWPPPPPCPGGAREKKAREILTPELSSPTLRTIR